MEKVRVLYINPNKADAISENRYIPDMCDEEFAKYADTYDLGTFAAMFNDDEISDLGYIRFINI